MSETQQETKQPADDAATAPETTAPTPPEDTLGDAGKAALDAERKTAREATKQLKQLQAKLKEFEDANKSDLEKATARAEASEKAAAELAGRYQQMVTRHTVATAATAAGAIDPDTIVALIAADLTYDEDGNPVDVDKKITKLQAAKPFLFQAQGTASGQARQGSRSAPALNSDALTEALKRATGAQ